MDVHVRLTTTETAAQTLLRRPKLAASRRIPSSIRAVGIAPYPMTGLRVWSIEPYSYGIIRCMKKTLHIDERLLREARTASGAATDTATVRLGLEALVRHAAYERMRALRGSEPKGRDVPRRRERPSPKQVA
jgi:Bacterial antitoxin of type II TA system, VapB